MTKKNYSKYEAKEELVTLSFNHVLLHKKDTKIYQVIFLSLPKGLLFQKICIPLQRLFPPRFPFAQRTRVGLLLFTIPTTAYSKMTLGGIILCHLSI